MARLLSEMNKVDIALVPANLNGAGTGPYYNMGLRRKALFVWEVGAMASGVTSIGQVMQATDDAGTGAKVVTNNAATITANTGVASLTITCATVVATDAVIINGLTYTAAAAADLPNRVFAVGADDTACAASLASAINHATAGVPGVKATSALGVVTVVAAEPGNTTITASSSDATITVATVRAMRMELRITWEITLLWHLISRRNLPEVPAPARQGDPARERSPAEGVAKKPARG